MTDQDPSLPEVGVARDLLQEERAVAVILRLAGGGSLLLTALLLSDMEVQTAEENGPDPTQDLQTEGLFAVTFREGFAPVVILANTHTIRPRVPRVQRTSKGVQCLLCQRSPAFVSITRVESALETSVLISMRSLQPLLRCLLHPLRVAPREGRTVLPLFLRIVERGVPRPSGSLGNDLWS